jgi:hypothetical protein
MEVVPVMNISATRERRSQCYRFLSPYFRFRCVSQDCAVYVRQFFYQLERPEGSGRREQQADGSNRTGIDWQMVNTL